MMIRYSGWNRSIAQARKLPGRTYVIVSARTQAEAFEKAEPLLLAKKNVAEKKRRLDAIHARTKQFYGNR